MSPQRGLSKLPVISIKPNGWRPAVNATPEAEEQGEAAGAARRETRTVMARRGDPADGVVVPSPQLSQGGRRPRRNRVAAAVAQEPLGPPVITHEGQGARPPPWRALTGMMGGRRHSRTLLHRQTRREPLRRTERGRTLRYYSVSCSRWRLTSMYSRSLRCPCPRALPSAAGAHSDAGSLPWRRTRWLIERESHLTLCGRPRVTRKGGRRRCGV